MTTGEVIQKCRWSRGWTQQKLSDISGVPRQTIGCAELNKRGTSVAILTELLNAMGYELVVAEKIDDGKQTPKYRIAEAVIGKTL